MLKLKNGVQNVGLKNYHPSKCIGTPEELAKPAQFIVENESLFFNGAIVAFSGGITGCLYDPN